MLPRVPEAAPGSRGTSVVVEPPVDGEPSTMAGGAPHEPLARERSEEPDPQGVRLEHQEKANCYHKSHYDNRVPHGFPTFLLICRALLLTSS